MDTIFGFSPTSQPGLFLNGRRQLAVYRPGLRHAQKMLWGVAAAFGLFVAAVMTALSGVVPVAHLDWPLIVCGASVLSVYVFAAPVVHSFERPDEPWAQLFAAYGDRVEIDDLLLLRARLGERCVQLVGCRPEVVAKAAELLRRDDREVAVEAIIELADTEQRVTTEQRASERTALARSVLSAVEA